MVRCGVAAHPRDWERVGLHEIMGTRRRCRPIDAGRLCWRLRARRIEEVRQKLELSLAERIARGQAKREACWTEGLAVGSRQCVEKVQPLILSRRETEIVAATEAVWCLQEAAAPYGQKAGIKIGSKGQGFVSISSFSAVGCLARRGNRGFEDGTKRHVTDRRVV